MDFEKYLAEFIGTFFLLLIGTGAIIINDLSNNALGHMGIAFAFGFIITVMIYATGHISGAHFNPAVTLAFAHVGKFEKKQIIPYILSQLLGGLSASTLLRILFGNVSNLGSTLPTLPTGSNLVLVSFVFELIFTFLLMFVIMGVATDSRAEGSFAGLAIGLTVFLGATVAGPISGGSLNPARSIAPALLSGNLQYLWLYILAPILGATCAALTYNYLSEQSLKKPEPQKILTPNQVSDV